MSGVNRKKEDVFIESIMVKIIKFGVTMGLYRKGQMGEMNIKYLITESSISKTVVGVPKSLIR